VLIERDLYKNGPKKDKKISAMSTSPTSPKNHQGNRSFRNSSGSESKDQRVSAVEMSPSPSIVDAIANTTIDARKKKKLYFILDISIGGKSKQIA
jgi:hypothetical protein